MSNKRPLELYDNTRISAFKGCPRFYYYRHVRDWIPDKRKSAALVFGSCWHDAMDVVWKHMTNGIVPRWDKEDVVKAAFTTFTSRWEEEGMTPWDDMPMEEQVALSPRTPMVALEMLYEYVISRQRFLSQCTLIEIERPFAVPIDPAQPNLFYVGRLDKVFEFEGNTYAGEHKTSSLYKKGGPFRESFIDSFSPNSQVDGYLFAGHLLYGDGMKAVWVDAALVHKDVHDGFRFIPVERAFEQLDAWLWETHYWIESIRQNKEALSSAHEEKYMAAFPKNTAFCYHFGGACEYIDLCKMWANPHREETPAGFREHKWEPFDEEKLQRLGLGE